MRAKFPKAEGRWLSIVAILCFTLLAVALLIAHQSHATGYEFSIYSATPLSVWVLLFLSFIGGIGIIVHQVATKGYRGSRFWLIGLLLLILSRMTLLYLPYIRGYVSWRGDNVSHLGLVKDILFSGHFAADNSYPITHTLLSQTISITGIPDIIVANLSTTLLSIMFVLSTYLLSTALMSHRGQQLLATLLAGGVMLMGGYNVLLTPNGWSIFLLPLLFYCYFKRSIRPYNILFLMLLVLYPFFHPLSSLVVIVALCLLELSRWLSPRIFKRKATLAVSLATKPPGSPIFIELVIFVPWVLSFQQFHRSLRLMWRQITTGLGPAGISKIAVDLSKVNVHGVDLVILLFKMHGATIIFIILTLIGVVLLWKQVRSSDIGDKSYDLLSFAGVFLFSSVLYVFYLSGMLGLEAIAGERMLKYVTLLTPIFTAFALYELLQRVDFRRLAYGGIMCLVILCSALSIGSLYHSPYILQPNPQITQMDMTGMTWFIEEKSRTFECANTLSNPPRLTQGILGTIEASKRTDIRRGLPSIPDHFGYTEHNTLGEQYSQDKYVTIARIDRVTYTAVWKEIGRFNDADFERLEDDPTVGKLYSNGELDVYFILGQGSP